MGYILLCMLRSGYYLFKNKTCILSVSYFDLGMCLPLVDPPHNTTITWLHLDCQSPGPSVSSHPGGLLRLNVLSIENRKIPPLSPPWLLLQMPPVRQSSVNSQTGTLASFQAADPATGAPSGPRRTPCKPRRALPLPSPS